MITEFEIPTPKSGPYGIASGPDGNLWFTERFGNKIGCFTTDAAVTEIPTPGGPAGIAVAPDGTIWFAEFQGNRIGRIQLAPTGREPPTPAEGSRGQPISVSPRKTGN